MSSRCCFDSVARSHRIAHNSAHAHSPIHAPPLHHARAVASGRSKPVKEDDCMGIYSQLQVRATRHHIAWTRHTTHAQVAQPRPRRGSSYHWRPLDVCLPPDKAFAVMAHRVRDRGLRPGASSRTRRGCVKEAQGTRREGLRDRESGMTGRERGAVHKLKDFRRWVGSCG